MSNSAKLTIVAILLIYTLGRSWVFYVNSEKDSFEKLALDQIETTEQISLILDQNFNRKLGEKDLSKIVFFGKESSKFFIRFGELGGLEKLDRNLQEELKEKSQKALDRYISAYRRFIDSPIDRTDTVKLIDSIRFVSFDLSL